MADKRQMEYRSCYNESTGSLMIVLKNLALSLYPTLEDGYCLDDQSRKCNSLYNKLGETAHTQMAEYRKTGDKECAQVLFSPYGLRNLVPSLKEKHPFLKSVHSSPLKNTALRLAAAIKKCIQETRKGIKVGWPRFRRWKDDWFSLLYDEPNKGFKIVGNILHLSLGTGIDGKRRSLKIPIANAHLLKDKTIRTLRIIKKHGRFGAVFTVEHKVPDAKPIKKIIAFDPNHKNLLYGVDNEGRVLILESPYWLKVSDRRIDELRSKLDRCEKKSKKIEVIVDGKTIIYYEESRRYKKIRRALDKALAKRREHIKLFCYRSANLLCKQYDLIAVGDYAPHGQGITKPMRRAMNNRSLIGFVKKIISWVALKSGKHYTEFNEQGTTRTCHACSFVMGEGIHPSVRHWRCPNCMIEHIRDENAACNGLRKISRELSLPVPSSGLVEIKERWAWNVLSSGSVVRRGDITAEEICTFKKLNMGCGNSMPIAIQ